MSAGLDGAGEAYLVDMIERGAGPYMDIVGAHPYGGTPAIAVRRMQIMRRILSHFNLQKPLWITEIGWQSGGWKSGPGVVATEEMKAEFLTEAMPALHDIADVVIWYKGAEAGRLYGLMQPVGDTGVHLQPAWHALRKLAGKRAQETPRGDVEVHVESQRLNAAAAQETVLRGRVRNGTDGVLHVRWIGLERSWQPDGNVAEIEPGTEREVRETFSPNRFVRGQERDVILTAQSHPGRRHLGCGVTRLIIDNRGRVIDIEVSGSAAQWIESAPDPLRLAPGKTGWVGLHVRVPEDAAPGTYTLKAAAKTTGAEPVAAAFAGSCSISTAEPLDDTADE